MPRRTIPDTLSLSLGTRIKQLREESGLTIERLAYESELGSKGHLSSIERGLVRPTAHTLKALADGLNTTLVDLVNVPDEGERQRLIELTRHLPATRLKGLIRQVEDQLDRSPVLKAAEGGATYARGGAAPPKSGRRSPRAR